MEKVIDQVMVNWLNKLKTVKPDSQECQNIVENLKILNDINCDMIKAELNQKESVQKEKEFELKLEEFGLKRREFEELKLKEFGLKKKELELEEMEFKDIKLKDIALRYAELEQKLNAIELDGKKKEAEVKARKFDGVMRIAGNAVGGVMSILAILVVGRMENDGGIILPGNLLGFVRKKFD